MREQMFRNLDDSVMIFGFQASELFVLASILVFGTEAAHFFSISTGWIIGIVFALALTLRFIRKEFGKKAIQKSLRYFLLPEKIPEQRPSINRRFHEHSD